MLLDFDVGEGSRAVGGGNMRMLATLSGWGDTRRERRDCQIGDLADVRRIWEEGESP